MFSLSSEWFERNYRYLIFLPLALLIVYALIIPKIKLGIDFKGGILVKVNAEREIDTGAVEEAVKGVIRAGEVRVVPVYSEKGFGAIVETTHDERITKAAELLERWRETGVEVYKNEALGLLKEFKPDLNVEQDPGKALIQAIEWEKKRVEEAVKKVTGGETIVSEISPILGAEFWGIMVKIAISAAVLFVIVAILFFRRLLPSGLMIFSALFDGLTMLAIMSLFDIPLTLETITIVLMQVGFSADTDVVLFTKVLKGKKRLGDAVSEAFGTGITMTVAGIISMVFVYLVGWYTQNISVLRVANTLLFGLFSDIFSTWFVVAPILAFFEKRRENNASAA